MAALSRSAFLTLKDTVVHHPHFYIQMQMTINVLGFNCFFQQNCLNPFSKLAFHSVNSSYPKCFLKEMLGDSVMCLPALLLLGLLTLVPSQRMKFSKVTCVSTAILRKGC